jgi:hypothetical protein
MSKPRLELHQILEQIIGTRLDGKPNVYFQPPPNVQMVFPCIKYSLQNMDTQYADDNPYILVNSYSIQVIDPNPDSIYPSKVAELPACRFERFFTTDNLNHYNFIIFW